MVNSLGKVTVATAGTLVRLTVNISASLTRVGAQAIVVQPVPGNTGVVYIGLAGMDKTTGAGVLAIVPAPASATQGPFPQVKIELPQVPAGLNAAELYVDASANAQAIFGYYTQG